MNHAWKSAQGRRTLVILAWLSFGLVLSMPSAGRSAEPVRIAGADAAVPANGNVALAAASEIAFVTKAAPSAAQLLRDAKLKHVAIIGLQADD